MPSLLHGPYKQSYREELLAELLRAQTEIQKNAPKGLETFSLISIEELEEIRRIWVEEKHEIEDNLPRIYQEVTGKKYPASESDDASIFTPEDLAILKEISASPSDTEHMQYQMLREMLQIEQSYRGAYRRVGIFDLLEKSVKDHVFHDSKEALEFLMNNTDVEIPEDESISSQPDLFDENKSLEQRS